LGPGDARRTVSANRENNTLRHSRQLDLARAQPLFSRRQSASSVAENP
jgi:hypothetical protein